MKNIVTKVKNHIYSNNKVLSLIAGVTLASTMTTAYAAKDIGEMVSGVMALLLNIFTVYGVIYLVIGIKAVVGAISEDGGTDQQALSKGKGQIMRGIVCVAAGSIIQLIVGVNPADIGSIFTT